MDTGLRIIKRNEKNYDTRDIIITIINTRSLSIQISMVARGIRERISEINDNSGEYLKDMVSKGRFEMYIKLLKIDKRQEVTDFTYQINRTIKEQRNC